MFLPFAVFRREIANIFSFFPPSYVKKKKNKLVTKNCRIHKIIKKFVQVERSGQIEKLFGELK